MRAVADILLDTHEARILERSGKDLPLDDERCRPRERSTWEKHQALMARQRKRRAAIRADRDLLEARVVELDAAGWLRTAIETEVGLPLRAIGRVLAKAKRGGP